MHYVEIDVANLRRWLATRPDTMDVTGYVLYFSDRRGNKDLGGNERRRRARRRRTACSTQPTTSATTARRANWGSRTSSTRGPRRACRTAALDAGEDVNGNGALDVYGGDAAAVSRRRHGLPHGRAMPAWAAGDRRDRASWARGRGGRPHHAGAGERRAGEPARVLPPGRQAGQRRLHAGALRLPHNGTQGLSVVAENPFYVQGNYNAPDAAGTGFGTTPGTDHVSAAVIADSVTMLSNNFNDIRIVHVAAQRDRRSP